VYSQFHCFVFEVSVLVRISPGGHVAVVSFCRRLKHIMQLFGLLCGRCHEPLAKRDDVSECKNRAVGHKRLNELLV
jgi:hypothetical protein